MRIIFLTMLIANAACIASIRSTAAAPANGAAIIGAGQMTSLLQDARVINVFRCKINGRWRPGRCPDRYHITCVHHRTEKFRNFGHCRTPSR